MASAFDPSAFIQAEQSQTVAAEPFRFSGAVVKAETAVFCEKLPDPKPAVATIAGIAASDAKELEWSADLEAWASRDCPAGIKPELWDEITHEAVTTSARWGRVAIDLGWSVLDLFGCNPDPLARRVDRNGLVATMVGLRSPVRLTAVYHDHAELTAHRGVVMRYCPMLGPGAVPLWSAYVMRSGP